MEALEGFLDLTSCGHKCGQQMTVDMQSMTDGKLVLESSRQRFNEAFLHRLFIRWLEHALRIIDQLAV